MRIVNEEGQFCDTASCEDCTCESPKLEIPEVGGNPFKEMEFYRDGEVKEAVEAVKPSDQQVGGDHYKRFTIQPTEFITKNKLSFLEGCIIKRICRYRYKGTPREDLEKIKHEVDLLIEYEGL